MQFLYQPLTWGFLLIGVPILVHLINMLRHRRMKWAAMDFLLESNRKNRRWVMLKQWLLLASRILAMILLVLMLAKWVSNSQLLGFLGGSTTHHYLLLDDSYSMLEVDQGESAYSKGLKAMEGIIRSVAARSGQHQVTLLRYSRASIAQRGSAEEARIDAAADLFARSVPADPKRLLDRINATSAAAMQLSADDALDLISPLITENPDEQAKVYFITDLRRNEFGEPETTKTKLKTLADSAAEFQFVDCGADATANLTAVSATPAMEVWATGVPLMVRFQVRNQSSQPVRNTVVRVKTISYPAGATAPKPEAEFSGQIQELPPIVIERIDPLQTVSRQVQVVFGSAGQHVVELTIPDDALQIDNKRWCVIDIKQSQKVLLVDGEIDGTNSFYFETAINPDRRLNTGNSIEKADATYLRDASLSALEQFDVIALLDVPRLEPEAIHKLEDFCRKGHGVFFLGGQNTNIQFVNDQLFRDGQGIYPVSIDGIQELVQSVGSAEPNVIAMDHPVLSQMANLSTSPFFLVRIRKHLLAKLDSFNDPLTDVVAYGPNRAPILVDKSFGDGRVLALLTGLNSQWSNWAQDPTFVVVALQSLGYLGSFRRNETSQPVGTRLEMVVTGQTVLPDAEVLIPGGELTSRLRLQRKVQEKLASGTQQSEAILTLQPSLSTDGRDIIDGLLRPGVFETWMVNSQGIQLVQNEARNVAAGEGNLDRVSRTELKERMGSLPVEIQSASSVSGRGLSAEDTSQSTTVMALLVLLLMGEQVLAYSASYHTPTASGVAR